MAAARTFKAITRPNILSSPSTLDLTAITYNILADKYGKIDHHNYCPLEHRSWESRAPRILKELSSYHPDILCLQEVERPFMEQELGPYLQTNLHHEWLYCGRRRKPNDPVPGPEEGVCLSYNTTRLEKIDSTTIRFGDIVRTKLLPKANSPGSKSRPSGSGGNSNGSLFFDFMADREDGAAVALLRDRETDKLLVAASTHLYWNPSFPEVKAAQASLLCKGIVEFLESSGVVSRRFSSSNASTMPIIIGGDFNSLPIKHKSDAFDTILEGGAPLVSGAYSLLTQGSISPTHQDHPAVRRPAEKALLNDLNLTSGGLNLASANFEAWGTEPPFTNHTLNFTGCLDYIFYSPKSLQISEVLEMPYKIQEESVDFGVIPDQIWPSDHLAVGAKFRWI